MNKSVIKKIVSVIACIGIIAGCTSISNAYSISYGSSAYIKTDYATPDYSSYYLYDVDFIQFSGMAVGSYIPGLCIRAELNGYSDDVCYVESNHGAGYYDVTSAGYHQFRLYNHSGRHVTIDFENIYF